MLLISNTFFSTQYCPMEDDTRNINGWDPNEGSSQKRKRSSNDCSTQSKKKSQPVYPRSPLNTNTPQQSNPRRSGTLPLKRVLVRFWVISQIRSILHQVNLDLVFLTLLNLLTNMQIHQEARSEYSLPTTYV